MIEDKQMVHRLRVQRMIQPVTRLLIDWRAAAVGLFIVHLGAAPAWEGGLLPVSVFLTYAVKVAAQFALSCLAVRFMAEGSLFRMFVVVCAVGLLGVGSAVHLSATELGNLPLRLRWTIGACLGIGPALALGVGRRMRPILLLRPYVGAAVVVVATVGYGSTYVVRPGEYVVAHFFVLTSFLVLVAAVTTGARLDRGRAIAATVLSLAGLAWPGSAATVVALKHDPGAILVAATTGLARRVWTRARVDRKDVSPERYGLDPAWFSAPVPHGNTAAAKPIVSNPIVFLIVVDSLRADVVRAGIEDGSLPTFRALARRGAAFENARSTASSTTPALVSLFGGKYYSQFRWTKIRFGNKRKYFPVDDGSPRLAELLSAAGVRTYSVTPGGGFLGRFGTTRGFQVERVPGTKAEQIASAATKVVDALNGDPALVYVHFLDPHFPYEGPRDLDDRGRYLLEVQTVDAAIGSIRRAVRKAGLAKRAIYVVVADHGEAFGEHGTFGHAATIYEELVRVPVILSGPNWRMSRPTEAVSLIDVGPTVLEIFGVHVPAEWMGQSLLPTVEGRRVAYSRPIGLDAGRRMQGIVFPDGVKAIIDLHRGTEEVYDLAVDPDETTNLADSPDGRARILLVEQFFAAHEYRAPGYVTPYRP
ncbi:MAG: hypothetical protein D6705_17275 [Deltaproteobacteria bacterium]|nr:MAG: hypothetical protein D6705_17275 [Deltaproteobacteria bacterium]